MPGYYWSATELNNLMPQPVRGVNLIGPSTNPLDWNDFDTLISMTEGEAHAAAAEGGYAFPVSSLASVAWGFMRFVVGRGAMAYALETITPGSKTSDDYKAEYRRALDLIRRGEATLLGADSLTSETGGRALPRSGGIASPWISATWEP